jgi:GTP cyclohydrolase II
LSPTARRFAEADAPTEYGVVRAVVYRVEPPGGRPASSGSGSGSGHGDLERPPEEHVALVVGDLAAGGGAPTLTRVHSECWTGEVMRSQKCDCRDQLDHAMRAIAAAGRGVVVYLRQEGRGIGLGNKIRAYALQQDGADTVDANRMLGFVDDARSYEVAVAILRDLGVARVALMTNNPRKVEGLRAGGVEVVERIALKPAPNEHNASYLAVKVAKMGHTP